jgi:hypothetical protein
LYIDSFVKVVGVVGHFCVMGEEGRVGSRVCVGGGRWGVSQFACVFKRFLEPFPKEARRGTSKCATRGLAKYAGFSGVGLLNQSESQFVKMAFGAFEVAF